MLSKINEKLEEASMVQFMGKFDKNPFLLRFKRREYPIGAGVPRFVVDFKEVHCVGRSVHGWENRN